MSKSLVPKETADKSEGEKNVYSKLISLAYCLALALEHLQNILNPECSAV